MAAGKRVGLIGVGLMGYGIGKNIVTKGHSLKVLAHKNREPVEKLLKLGATEGKSPREIVDWFAGREPQTAQGAMALASAYRSLGDAPKAAGLIRSWWRDRSFEVEPGWGLDTLADGATGSGLVVWDSGSPLPPIDDQPPRAGHDPHEDPRRSPLAQAQKDAFLRHDGTIPDECPSVACTAPPT